jgi:outer membrane protein assembly factor BamA
MKVAVTFPITWLFFSSNILKDIRRNLWTCNFLLIGVFTGILPSNAQRQPAGFYELVDTKLSIDSNSKIFISSIYINGNKQTKKYIIEREMRLKAGDSILAASIFEKLQRSQELIYNTTLFTEVKLVPHFISATDISIQVTVKEKWYIYPIPQFQLVDRNLNEWLHTYHADFERVIYGAKFVHYNLSGRRDQLKVYLLDGYARNFSITYSAPYSNQALTEGFSVTAGYTQNREIIYKTSADNLPLRYSNKSFVRNFFSGGGSYNIRRGFYKRHIFSIGYSYINVDDSITKVYNPAYFNTDKNYVGYPELGYIYQYINTNNISYPLSGKVYSLALLKRGLGFTGGINMLAIDGNYNKYLSNGKNWYSSIQGSAKIKVPFTQPFINQRAFGYGEFYLRGLEDYVIDGVANFLTKYTLRKKMFSFNIPFPIKNKLIPIIPISFFAKTFTDMGYSYNKPAFDTRLGNCFLYTGGFGLDILTLYDINLSLEYSFNQLGEKGLFLHAKGGF